MTFKIWIHNTRLPFIQECFPVEILKADGDYSYIRFSLVHDCDALFLFQAGCAWGTQYTHPVNLVP